MSNKLQCYLCKKITDKISYSCDDKLLYKNIFAICEECNEKSGRGGSYYDCCKCDEEMYHNQLKMLIDIYGEIDLCLTCNIKNNYCFKDPFNWPDRKEYINEMNEVYKKNDVENTNKYMFKDNYTDFILKEDPYDFKKRVKENFEKTLRKNTLKSKCISIFKKDKSLFIELKKEKDMKMEIFQEKIKKKYHKIKSFKCFI